MKMLSIRNGYVTIQLSATQCAILAKACHFANDKTLSEDIDHWRTMTALFHACAIAGYAQWQMCPLDAVMLDEQLFLAGLGDFEST